MSGTFLGSQRIEDKIVEIEETQEEDVVIRDWPSIESAFYQRMELNDPANSELYNQRAAYHYNKKSINVIYK